MFYNSYKRENEILRAELSAARAAYSDLQAAFLEHQKGCAEERSALIDKIIAQNNPASYTLLHPPAPRTPRPRVPQTSRWPGWRPDTEPTEMTPEITGLEQALKNAEMVG